MDPENVQKLPPEKKEKGARFQFIDCKHDVSWQAEMLGKLSAFEFTSEAMVVLNNLFLGSGATS